MILSPAGLGRLAWRSVVAPREVAAMILNLRLASPVLWMALALMTILNTILSTLTTLAVPVAGPLPVFMSTPAMFAVFLGGGLVLTVFALVWTGRAMGGQGSIPGMLALICWLQALRVLVQAAMLILVVVALPLATPLALASGLAGLWILTNFIDTAHGFDSLFKAVGVLLIAVAGAAVGLAVLLGMVGVTAMGLNTDV